MTPTFEELRQAVLDLVDIKVLHAQDDWVSNRGAPPEQVIMVDGVEYRTRSPLVIQCLFEGSDEEDTDALSVATNEWLHWVHEALEQDPDVRLGLLQALGEEHPTVKRIHDCEKAALDQYLTAIHQEQA